MKLSTSTIEAIFLIISLTFYLNFILFFTNIFSTDIVQENAEAAAAGKTINQFIGVLLLLCSIFLIYKKSNLNFTTLIRQAYPWIILILFFILGLFWSDAPQISFRRIVAFSTLVLVCYVLAQIYSPSSILTCVYQLIVASVILGLCWTIIQGKALSFGLEDRSDGFKGIFSDKNGAARLYAYGLIIGVGLKQYRTKIQVLSLCLLILALSFSQSASAIILVTLGCGLVLVFRFSKSKKKDTNLLQFILTIIFILVGAYLVMILYTSILELLGRDSNLTDRSIIWSLIAPYIDDRLYLGYGFGTFWASAASAAFIERWGFISNAHSGYFEVMLHGGLVGLSIFFILIFILLKRISWVYINKPSQHLNELMLALIVVQLVGNYVAYIIFNHNSADMFVFSLCFFTISKFYVDQKKEYKNKRNLSEKG
ncbi:MAG: exopolysaccharide production protein ExoQ [Glaciecola sp.]|jgi:exopolysaccharide production protein ExoQ